MYEVNVTFVGRKTGAIGISYLIQLLLKVNNISEECISSAIYEAGYEDLKNIKFTIEM